jgi:ABC-2 type transport system permease protein
MGRALISRLSKILNPAWMTGPIFDKELRVSSRRRRNYALRLLYLAGLTVLLVLVWLSAVRYGGSAAVYVSQMAEAAKAIITAIIVFQFLAAQLIAVVMLSTSISDEIYHRTLGLLMTTPINGLQIVMGKLFSKLLQIILLLALSLPLLALVRVFGGVPWDYVISGLCMTVTAAIFAGSLSLYFSMSSRSAYVVILKTIFVLGFLYAFIPAIGGVFLRGIFLRSLRAGSPNILLPLLLHTNPLAAMWFITMMMLTPAAGPWFPFFSWPVHCAVMLAASALVLARSVQIVRVVALRQAAGQLDYSSKQTRAKHKNPVAGSTKLPESDELVRRVEGSPIIWKELRAPTIQGPTAKNSVIGLAVTIVALLMTYLAGEMQDCLDRDFAQTSYTLLFLTLGVIVQMVLSAACITREKESQCWPILLATSIDDWHILLGKAFAVFRRCLPIWLLLAGHIMLFVAVGYIHPIAILHLPMLVVWVVVFVTGAGLYFSARFKRTTTAVVANFALALILWAVIPLLLLLEAQILRRHGVGILRLCLAANPFVQAGVIMTAAGGRYNAYTTLSGLIYKWPYASHRLAYTTLIMFVTMLTYTVVGVLFAWRAKARFRKGIF